MSWSRRLKASMLTAACVLASACTLSETPVRGSPSPAELTISQLRGRSIAETLCSGCHAIGTTGMSPHLEAKPFREISQQYPVRSLEEALAEGIFVGHPDMPPFQFAPGEIDDLLNYIEAIQDPA